MKNRLFKNYQMLMLLCALTFFGVFSAQAREKEPDENDLSLFMDESIYEAQEHFHCDAPVPARGFSLFMQLGELNEDGTAEAGMTAYSDTGIVRSVQINKTLQMSKMLLCVLSSCLEELICLFSINLLKSCVTSLTIKEFLIRYCSSLRIKSELLVSAIRIESEEIPVSSVNSLLLLIHSLAHTCSDTVVDTRSVCNDK